MRLLVASCLLLLHLSRAAASGGEGLKEHAGKGSDAWRDPGVFVDGELVGVLYQEELPRALKPTLVSIKELLPFRPGDPGPHERTVQVPRYRLAGYLLAVGVPLDQVRAVHIYGGQSAVAVVSGADLLRVQDRLLFAYTGGNDDKVRIFFPRDLRTTTFDRITTVAVYVKRLPPVIDEDGRASLDGKLVEGIPYHGLPRRGGVRIYRDDRLAAWIKRNQLSADVVVPGSAERGEARYWLAPILRSQGVQLKGVRHVALFDHGQEVGRVPVAELDRLEFSMASQGRSQLMVYDGARSWAASTVRLASADAESRKRR